MGRGGEGGLVGGVSVYMHGCIVCGGWVRCLSCTMSSYSQYMRTELFQIMKRIPLEFSAMKYQFP